MSKTKHALHMYCIRVRSVKTSTKQERPIGMYLNLIIFYLNDPARTITKVTYTCVYTKLTNAHYSPIPEELV